MKKTAVEGQDVPDRNEECLLYQTLVGVWPLGRPDDTEYDAFKKRIKDYIIKALREAKVNTSWINQRRLHDSVTSLSCLGDY
jgi:(1->4)-alpha-D-glucan 1-alpha-D-glucosylmutase